MNTKNKKVWRSYGRLTSLGIAVGVAIGAAVGAATGDMGVWIGAGAGFGVAIGMAIDWVACRKPTDSKIFQQSARTA